MSRLGAWWLRNEKSIADGCEDFVVALGLGPWIGVPYAHRPTRRELAEQSAADLRRIADALESSQLGSEATAPAGDPSQPPSSEAAAGETGICGHMWDPLLVLTDSEESCGLPPGHSGQHCGYGHTWS